MYLFKHNGVHCLVDGQYGSTGKGALSAYLAKEAINDGLMHSIGGSIYSGGPNSGHTSYHYGMKVVLKQLPTFGVSMALHGFPIPIYLSAGAIIDPEILKAEVEAYPTVRVFVHPNAAIVTDEDRRAEEIGSIAAVAGTRSGTGAALIRKIARNPNAVASRSLGRIAPNVVIQDHRIKPEKNAYFMEVAQGFSLGINSCFYPKVTSRECTVMQGLADARIPARSLAQTYMAVRTFPIRVGNVDGHSSGDWYNDQMETSWNEIGVLPELTTVTQRERRVATFSMTQFYDACHANDPDVVFLSHCDYLSREELLNLLEDLVDARMVMNKTFTFLLGFGPGIGDIHGEEYAYRHR